MGQDIRAVGGVGLVIDLDAHDLDEDLIEDLRNALSWTHGGLVCSRIGPYPGENGTNLIFIGEGINRDVFRSFSSEALPIPNLLTTIAKIRQFLYHDVEGLPRDVADKFLAVKENIGLHVHGHVF